MHDLGGSAGGDNPKGLARQVVERGFAGSGGMLMHLCGTPQGLGGTELHAADLKTG